MPAYETRDWYDEPRYYDLLLEEDNEVDADFLEVILERYAAPAAIRRGGVLEPACGSGRLVRELARRGHAVLGTDLSASMLAFARAALEREGLAAELREAPMQSFRTRRRFALAHCLVGSFRYLLSEREAVAHLRGIAEVLRSGGVYVLGLHLVQYDYERKQRERWEVERDGAHVVCNLQSWPADRRRRRERLRSRLVVREDGAEHRYETHWEWRTYDAQELARTLARVPELEHVATYDFDYDLAQPCRLDDGGLDRILVLRRR